MNTTLHDQGDEIAALLNGLEAQLDACFRTAARLNLSASEFADASGLTIRAGQPVIEHLGRLSSLIASARGEVIGAHRHIERIGRMAGYGDGEPKPDGFFRTAELPTTVVALAA